MQIVKNGPSPKIAPYKSGGEVKMVKYVEIF